MISCHNLTLYRPFTSRRRLLGTACAVAVLAGFVSVVPLSARDAILRWNGNLVVPVDVRVLALPKTDNYAAATVTLRNLTANPIRVVGASTTCSCIAATNAFPVTLGPYRKESFNFELAVPKDTRKGDQLGSARFFTESESKAPQVEFALGSN